MADMADPWPIKIAEMYMSWFTFFVTGNLVVMAWLHRTRVRAVGGLAAVYWVFLLQDIGGVFSTVVIMKYLVGVVPPNLRLTILVVGTSDCAALVGLVLAWLYVIKRGRVQPN